MDVKKTKQKTSNKKRPYEMNLRDEKNATLSILSLGSNLNKGYYTFYPIRLHPN